MNQLAANLLQAAGDQDSAACKRVHQLDIEICSLYAIMATGTAEDIRWLQTTKLENTSYATNAPDAGFWQNVQVCLPPRSGLMMGQAFEFLGPWHV